MPTHRTWICASSSTFPGACCRFPLARNSLLPDVPSNLSAMLPQIVFP